MTPQFRAEGSCSPYQVPADSEDISGQTRSSADKPPTLFSRSRISGFVLSPTGKTTLKEERFQDLEDFKKDVTVELNYVLFKGLSCFRSKRF
jgi:hypothetical protein